MLVRVSGRMFVGAVLALCLAAAIAVVAAETIDPVNNNSQFAWAENVGWINAEPANSGNAGITVSGTKLTGYMYGENIGWINLHCENRGTCAQVAYGVTNDNTGKLAGYAWSENGGWISFSCTNTPATCPTRGNYGVSIDPSTGIFSGAAWGENIGWIFFSDNSPVSYRVQTDDGDGVAGAVDNCAFDANANQSNTDAAPLLTSGLPPDDTIVMSDALGDVCDLDDDNDGLPDATETGGRPCATASGPTQPLVQDTDGDRNVDGAECQLGSNPNSVTSRPATAGQGDPGICPESPTLDDDGDRLLNSYETSIGTNPCNPDSDDDVVNDGWEFRGYGSSPLDSTSDADALPDCLEVTDVNGNEVVNAQDLGIIATVFGRADRPHQDIDKNGTINANDLAAAAAGITACPR